MLQKSNLIWKGVTLGALATSLLPANAFDLESVDKWMSYNIGELRIRPELALSTEFTDNVYYAGLESKHFVFAADPKLIPLSGGGFAYSANYVGKDNSGAQAVNGIYYDKTGKQIKAGDIYTGGVKEIDKPNSNTVDYYIPTQHLYAEGGNTSVSPRNSELITSATPGFKLQYGDEVLNYISLGYGVQMSKYLVSGVEADPQHNVRFHTKLEYSRIKLELDSGAQLSSSYLGGGQNLAIQKALVDRWNEDTSARLTYQMTPRISVYSEFDHNMIDYDSIIALYGSATWQGSFGAGYNISDDWKLFSEAHYGQTTISPSSSAIPNGPHSEVYGAYLGTQGTFTPRFSGYAKFGYEFRGYPSIGSEAVGAPAFDINVAYAAGPQTQLSLGYSRRTSPSSQISAQTYVFDYVTFTATQGLGGAGYWWTTFTTRYNRGDYSSRLALGNIYDSVPGTSLYALHTSTVDFGHTDDQIILSLALKYVPRAWLWVSLAYEYETYMPSFKDTRLNGNFLPEYDNHRVTLSVNLGY